MGSLGIRTASATDQAAFGNQVDFDGDLVGELTKIGFSVFTHVNNRVLNGSNMPTIRFDINPNLEPNVDGSSMVYVPAEREAFFGSWATYDATDDAQGPTWYLTGLAGGATGCEKATPCTFTDLQTALDDGGDPATIFTVGIYKGPDFAFSGAVDALTINDKTYDFEPLGVKVHSTK